MSPKCAFGTCDDTDTEPRISEVNGEVYHYCPDHDPLPSEGFSEVSDGD